MLTTPFESELHQEALNTAAERNKLYEREFATTFSASRALKATFRDAQDIVNRDIDANGLPEGQERWEVELPDWQFKSQQVTWMQSAAAGPVTSNPWLWFFLTIGLAVVGGALYMIPKFATHPGIKNDHIYHSPLTRGLNLGWRGFFLGLGLVGIIGYGIWYMDEKYVWPAVTAGIALLIIGLVLFTQRSYGRDVRDAGPEGLSGYLGILAGVYFIGFYILLYWASQHIVGWVAMVDPLSRMLSGNAASQWFLYGLMYTLIILVMGVRMIAKYRHKQVPAAADRLGYVLPDGLRVFDPRDPSGPQPAVV